MKRTLTAGGALLTALTAALTLAACGSSSDDGATSTTAKADRAFPALAAEARRLERRPTSIGIEEPVGAAIPEGKTIAYIRCGAPACATNGEYLRAALSTLGWTMRSIDAGTTPERIKAAYVQALQEKPDAVVGSGFPQALFASELRQLVAARVPVVQAYVTDPASDGVDVLAGNEMVELQGGHVADWLLAQLPSDDAEIGLIYTSAFPSLKVGADAFSRRVAEQCGNCKVQTLDVPGTSIGSDLPTRVTSFLAAHPKIRWAYVGYSDMIVGLPAALKGAGIGDVKLVTNSVNVAIAGYLRDDVLRAGIGVQTPEVYWRIADLLARRFAGRPTTVDSDDATLPFWAVTGANIPSTTEPFPGVADYQQQYRALWGLG